MSRGLKIKLSPRRTVSYFQEDVGAAAALLPAPGQVRSLRRALQDEAQGRHMRADTLVPLFTHYRTNYSMGCCLYWEASLTERYFWEESRQHFSELPPWSRIVPAGCRGSCAEPFAQLRPLGISRATSSTAPVLELQPGFGGSLGLITAINFPRRALR